MPRFYFDPHNIFVVFDDRGTELDFLEAAPGIPEFALDLVSFTFALELFVTEERLNV